MKKNKKIKMIYYTVYDNKDNVIAFGFGRDCAAMLGRSIKSFLCLVSRAQNKKSDKYAVVKEEVEVSSWKDAYRESEV